MLQTRDLLRVAGEGRESIDDAHNVERSILPVLMCGPSLDPIPVRLAQFTTSS